MEARSLQFGTAARALTATARRLALPIVPTFRSPPRAAGVERSLQHHRAGGVTIAVRMAGRPWPAVLADMVDGVVRANELTAPEAGAVRAALWSALQLAGVVPGEPAVGAGAPVPGRALPGASAA